MNTRAPAVEAFEDEARVTRALRRGVLDALDLHRRLGYPICVWRDGRVVWIPPEEIPSAGPPFPAGSSRTP